MKKKHHNLSEFVECTKNSDLLESYSIEYIYQKKSKFQTQYLSFNPRELEKQEQIKSKVSERKEKSEYKSVN